MVNDRSAYLQSVITKIAKELRVKIMIPYFAFSDVETVIKSRKNKSLCELSKKSSFITKYFIKKYAFQIYLKGKKKYLYYSPAWTFFLDKFGVLSPYPWYIGNGISDIVCVDSLHTYNRYKKNKVPKEKLKVVGDVAYDKLYNSYKDKENIKKQIINKYNLDKKKKIIIISLPQLAEHNILDWSTHWKEINFLVKAVENQNQNLLISLHPRMKKDRYAFLEDKYNCKILNERLFEVLPIAGLFLATFSSTVIWAVLCGVKSIVVDFYDLKYNMYNFLKSIKKVDQREKLEVILKTYLNKKVNFQEDWKILSRNQAFDGKTIERYYKIISSKY